MIRFDGKKSQARRDLLEASAGPDEIVRADAAVLPIADWRSYRKTVLTFAARMHDPFEVDTLEGLHTGKDGDYLAVGPAGEMYPIDAKVFEQSYEEVTE